MPIRVDLPAPFSPTIPWIVPARITSDTSRLAWTAPNDLSIPRSSMTVAAPLSICSAPSGGFAAAILGGDTGRGLRPPSGSLRHVVGDLDLAGRDVGASLREPPLHFRRDQAAIVLIEREADAALGHTQHAHPGL